jgi:uncharacterized RDD family membrane protein YckC
MIRAAPPHRGKVPMQENSWNIPDPETQSEFYADVATKRLVAWVIDMVVTVILSLVVVFLTAFIGTLFFPLLLVVVGFAYRATTIGRGSATWGMRVMAIELRTLSGERLDRTLAVLHTLGLTVSFAIPVLQLASIFMMLTSPRGQGLSDLVLGTVALNRRASA